MSLLRVGNKQEMPVCVCSGQDELSESCSPETLVHDAVTRMFWKNAKARSTNQASNPSTTTLAIPAGQIGEPYCWFFKIGSGIIDI